MKNLYTKLGFVILSALVLVPSTTFAAYWGNLGTAGFSSGAALVTDIAINSSNVPYVVYLNEVEGNKVNVNYFENNDWKTVGGNTPLSTTGANHPQVIFDSSDNVYVGYQDRGFNTYKATVSKFDNSWSKIGGNISSGTSSYNAITVDSNNNIYITYRDGSLSSKITAKKWDGSTWSTLGNAGFSAGDAHYQDLVVDSKDNIYVSYSDIANSNKATVMKWDGSTWSTLGTAGFSAGATKYNKIAIDSKDNLYVVYSDASLSNQATVMKWDGSTWSTLGTAGFSSGAVNHTSIVVDSKDVPYIGFVDIANSNKATVMKWDGSTWSTLGTAGFSSGEVNYMSLSIDSNDVIYSAFQDFDKYGYLTVMTYPDLQNFLPSVNTKSALSIESNSAIIKGEITDTGSDSIISRGFEYGKTKNYEKNVLESGTFSTGLFENELLNLEQNTTYYFRAYAQNSKGVNYGNWETFKTLKIGPTETTAREREVLVVYNSAYTDDTNNNSIQDSLEIANYYKDKRGIPDINVTSIDISMKSLEKYNAVTRDSYNTNIKKVLEDYLVSKDLKDKIKYIVFVKGVPLKIYDTSGEASNYVSTSGDYSSVDSSTALLFQLDQNNVFWSGKSGWLSNPYYNIDTDFNLTYRFKNSTFGDNFKLQYLVTRLDGYTLDDVKNMIDRGYNTDTSGNGMFVLDRYTKTNFNLDHLLSSAYNQLKNLGKNIHSDSATKGTSPIKSATDKVIAYTGYGIYAGLGNDYYNKELDFKYLNGAVTSTFESYAAFSTTEKDNTDHGQVAQFIQAGGSGGIGNVYEPYSNCIASPNVFMLAYNAGYTWADSAYMSLPCLDWTGVVFGDPLMQISVDVNAPEIVDVSAVSNSKDSFTINWTTNKFSPSKILYGVNKKYNQTNSGTENIRYAKKHSVTISNLQACTEYDYRIYLKNLDNKTSAGPKSTIKTLCN